MPPQVLRHVIRTADERQLRACDPRHRLDQIANTLVHADGMQAADITDDEGEVTRARFVGKLAKRARRMPSCATSVREGSAPRSRIKSSRRRVVIAMMLPTREATWRCRDAPRPVSGN